MALAAAVLAGGPGTAAGHDQDQVKAQVTPENAAPGAQVDVRVKGCSGTTGAAGSGAFTRDAELTGRDGKQNTLTGTTRVKLGVSGTYEITVTCDGHPHQGVGTVQVGAARQTPTAPVHAGGGGTAPLTGAAAAPEETGPGTRHAVVGLVLAGVAAVAVALRSVRRRRPE
ncbi:hypothetical protein ABT390_00365 [Streptomyces aurantiacus]|uniref:Uncharacterized protein n=1 Tax=Streptomyces aurantiacus JA 4570 TaxID=1286094 RepID=S3ZI03_9ACTN|nr:hypothetical protein [Streptomyces aurantiacus]EPH43251.1 hypothetical protein STRAU_3677 [Streptomyces aurantiacus JA 4570]